MEGKQEARGRRGVSYKASVCSGTSVPSVWSGCSYTRNSCWGRGVGLSPGKEVGEWDQKKCARGPGGVGKGKAKYVIYGRMIATYCCCILNIWVQAFFG